jgi:hypothetical protein
MEASTTTGRVPQNTAEQANERIRRGLEYRLAYYVQHPEHIDRRLRELDEEWDIERVLEANASTLVLVATVLGVLGKRRYFLLPLLVSGFLLQHAIQGWCPPLPLFRRMGVRTQYEIELERYALKILRGDLDQIKEQRKDTDAALNTLSRQPSGLPH